ncbi:hypothetical protein DM01DRAFT_1333502 [Hesseltinella vesiculosa]|uniref:Uncharacterized protein n=1 Tax=Hesseltinella vesiculosa TaxID=101127 RepID=A0A1X2GQ12_9FUNG|nr:hypothetical protein DM01DRAFT_1333502 [Hesseltinella vesiculosa]
MAEVIAQQLSSQDVIERTAEEHFDLETHRRQRSPSVASTTSTTSSLAPLEIPDDLTDIIDPTDYKEHDLTSPSAPCPLTPGATSSGQNTMSFLLADYLWRVFKILLLASLVALVYHFYMHHPQYFRFLLHPTTPLHGPPTW